MPTTVLVEPNAGGHRCQAVANVGDVAARRTEVLVLTSRGASADPAYKVFLGDRDFRVLEVFDSHLPPTREVARVLARLARTESVETVVVMDADQSLKRWWLEVPLAFGLRPRPRMIFMLTRYPAKLRLTDWVGWRLRLPKAVLSLVAIATGSLHRVAGFSGRDDMTPGWLVKRTRDPVVCSAHSRDQAQIRERHGLPVDRRIVGIFGVIEERKNARLVWEAMQAMSIDADLLLAGGLTPEVATWAAQVAESPFGRVVVRDGFLTNEVLDELVAASDVAPLLMTLNGPSGIMGKALAAGVPVVTAGSLVRAREVHATAGGVAAELDRDSVGEALARVLGTSWSVGEGNTVPVATSEEFGVRVLGPPYVIESG